ncbi:uncharacterized protein LOC135223347 [Macrobrachium nipponense]|uniref:uncharacterized protein LOC135223347 n=1 Tax=Macrobrachium nipponense TaxID=159736 RepID=UPI0030C8A10E
MARKHEGVLPILYALLPNKRRTTYVKMFRMITEMSAELQPKGIYCDYEQAAFSAMTECFPDVELKGCFFHFAHNIHKHLKQLGLQHLYNNDPDFSVKAKMIVALSFVPISHMDVYIDALAQYLPDELQPLMNWVEDNYVGRPLRRGNGRRSPLFPTQMWNRFIVERY